MRRSIAAAIFVPVFLFSAPAFTSVTLSAVSIKSGCVLLVTVRDNPAKSVTFDKKEFPLFKYDDSASRCFLGIPLDRKSGKAAVLAGTERAEFTVFAEEQPKEKLSLPGKEVVDEKLAARQHKRMLAAIAKVSTRKLWAGRFSKPVPGKVTTPFGMRREVNGEANGSHNGADLSGHEDSPVRAPASGIAVMCERTIATGNAVVLDHGQGVVSVYFHLNSINVKPGQAVGKGDVIGLVGSTGFSTGPHLHWGVYVFGTSVDPFCFVWKDFFKDFK